MEDSKKFFEPVRDHDALYLQENRKLTPKEYFKFVLGQSRSYLDTLPERAKVLDIGCATGDFLHYASSEYPNLSFEGMDVMPALLERAKAEVPAVKVWNQGSIANPRSLPATRYDAIFMMGVHSIFDGLDVWLDPVLSLLAPRGRVYVFGFFNPEPLDVLIRSREAGTEEPWQTGWNILAKKTVELELKRRKIAFEFKDWEIGIDLPRDKPDPLRSWTMRLQDGGRVVVNGLQMLHQHSLLEIKT